MEVTCVRRCLKRGKFEWDFDVDERKWKRVVYEKIMWLSQSNSYKDDESSIKTKFWMKVHFLIRLETQI